jgi:solute carrier family 25, member 42
MMNEEDPDDLSIQVTAFDEEEAEIIDFELGHHHDDDDDDNNNNNSNDGMSSNNMIVSPPRLDGIVDSNKNTSNNNVKFFDEYVNQFQQRMLQFPREARNLLAGGLAGMLAKSVVAPFDRIKILYQVSSAEFHIWKVPTIAWRIIQEEGFAALWKGNTATLIRVFPYSGIQFMVFDRCKTLWLKEQEMLYIQQKEAAIRTNQLPPPKPKWGLTPLESLVAGMTAGAVSVVATYPLDLTRAQLAVLRTTKKKPGSNDATTQHRSNGFVSTLVDNYRSRGPTGLFRGITPTLIGILPYSGLAFAFNEQAKRKVGLVTRIFFRKFGFLLSKQSTQCQFALFFLVRHCLTGTFLSFFLRYLNCYDVQIQNMTGRDLTTIERMQCGALSGLLAQTITYPLEVTRRRMQTIGIVATSGKDAAVDVVGKCHSLNPAAESAIRTVTPSRPPSMGAIVKELYQEQGVRGFFKGVSLNWFKGPIAFSISFTAFDTIQSFLETEAEKRQRLPRRRTTVTE